MYFALEIIYNRCSTRFVYMPTVAAVNGTNGESLSLTVAEREAVLEEWLKESAGRCILLDAQCSMYSNKRVVECRSHYMQVNCHCSRWM